MQKDFRPWEAYPCHGSFSESKWDMAADDAQASVWVLEEGKYIVWAGFSLEESFPAAVLELDNKYVVEKTKHESFPISLMRKNFCVKDTCSGAGHQRGILFRLSNEKFPGKTKRPIFTFFEYID